VIALLRKGPDAVARVVDDHIDAAILAERKASRRSASEPEPPSEPTERPGGPEPVEDAERWMGIDLPSEMRSDYVRSKTARLLRRFGIPLTAAFFRYQDADFPLDRIVTGIRARLNAMVADGRPADVFDVARQSVVMSPYPDWFPFLDWRESLSDLWASVGATDQPWWRDHDYVGSPYGEFETLRAEMPPGSSSELPGGASGSSPPDPEGLPDPLPSDAMAG
jgi:hypothetical protein